MTYEEAMAEAYDLRRLEDEASFGFERRWREKESVDPPRKEGRSETRPYDFNEEEGP